MIKDRFSGWSKTRIAAIATIEADVSFKVCYEVLFKGKAIKSNAARRVLKWAQREGYRITAPAKDVAKEVASTAANIEEAERVVGGFDIAK